MMPAGYADRIWVDMIHIYTDETVSTLCLTLQDEFDVDVPVMLVLALVGHTGLTCEKQALEQFLLEADAWRDHVVRPLRTIRRAMKGTFVSAPENALREEIKRLELRAEKLHVSRLVEALPAPGAGICNLTDFYLTQCGLPDQQRRDCQSLLHDVLTRATTTQDPMHCQKF